jgi:hypothetical protein
LAAKPLGDASSRDSRRTLGRRHLGALVLVITIKRLVAEPADRNVCPPVEAQGRADATSVLERMRTRGGFVSTWKQIERETNCSRS